MPMQDTPHDPAPDHHDLHEAETILPDSPPGAAIRHDHSTQSDLEIGQQLGPYKIIDMLGEGGFGSVYKAEQSKPVKRHVAIKIIKLGMDTKRVMARFEAERQALAVMDHPNIAHVLDAGATDSGRPYFVMELVRGIPLDDYCDQHNLTNEQRLALLIDICHAVQHAHQKGIIHRDLKPSNILVAIQDNAPTPKVIDFGIAKAMHQPLTEQAVYTQQQQLIGTPVYMSPEQAENSGLDIDTRTDIYSLGVILFELLTGSTPFECDELSRTAISDLPRKLREAPTPKPSNRITQLDAPRADTIAKHHQLKTTQLKRQLKGELDWIVLKALEKDRTRRYDSATALAEDIQRFLNDEPVLAGAPSTLYRFGKFAKRNKPALVAASFIAISVLAGLAFSSYAFYQERIEHNIAVLAQEEATRQRDAAVRARDESEAVTAFLEETLSAADPSELGRQVAVRDVLDIASQRIGTSFADQPHIEARLRRAIGDTYISLGLYDEAEAHLPQAVDILDAANDPNDDAMLRTQESLGTLYLKQGRFDEARELLEDTIETRRATSGDASLETLTAMRRLGTLYKVAGHFDNALDILTQADTQLTESFGEEHEETLRTREHIAHTYLVQGNLDLAEPIYLSTLDAQRRTLGDEHPDTLLTLNNLALLRRNQGLYPDAEPLYNEALAIQRRILGENHPNTLKTMTSLAWLYVQMSRAQEAQSLYEQTLALQRAVLGDEHPHTLDTMSNLAQLSIDRSRFDEALSLLTQTFELQQRALGDEHPDTLRTMGSLALVHRRLGNLGEAESRFLAVIDLDTRILGSDHPTTLSARTNLANVLSDLGRLDEAQSTLEDVLTLQIESLGQEHPTTIGIQINLAGLLWQQNKFDAAEPLYTSILDTSSRVLGEEHSYTLVAMSNLALLYRNQQRHNEAERMYLRTLDVQNRTLGEAHSSTLTTKQNLVSLYAATGRLEEAESLTREVLLQYTKSLGAKHPDTLRSAHILGDLLNRTEAYSDAIVMFTTAHDGRAEALGEDHVDTQDSRFMLAGLYYSTGELRQGALLYLRWLESRKRTHGDADGQAVGMATNMMLLFHQLGDTQTTRRITLDLLHTRQQAAQHTDASAQDHYHYALLLLECVPENLSDPSLALQHAQQASDITNQQNHAMLALLAQAQFALGDALSAAQTQRAALTLAPEGNVRTQYETLLVTYEKTADPAESAVDSND